MSYPFGRVGLLWIGQEFYETKEAFITEAYQLGISRRIGAIPKGFLVNRTWVWLAHRKGVCMPCGPCHGQSGQDDCPECEGQGVIDISAVFRAFKPMAIEYVVKGGESDEEIQRLIDRGITPVHIRRDEAVQSSYLPSEN